MQAVFDNLCFLEDVVPEGSGLKKLSAMQAVG
jgi:hypothetical protein